MPPKVDTADILLLKLRNEKLQRENERLQKLVVTLRERQAAAVRVIKSVQDSLPETNTEPTSLS